MTTLEPALLALIHGKLRVYYELSEQLARAPKQIEFALQREEQYRQKLAAISASLQELRLKSKEKQNDLAAREAQVKKMQLQQDGAANNREYAMLGDTIKATIAANEVLGDELLELLERCDEFAAKEKQATSVLAQACQETADTKTKIADTTKRLERELAETDGELAELLKKVPDDLRGELVRKRPALREKTVAPIDDGACSSCWQLISPQTRSALLMKHPINCPGCGALLYLPPNA